MRKYEPAGGVVSCEWKRGEPSSDEQYGVVLMERWDLSWDWQNKPQVEARIGAYRWSSTDRAWLTVGGGSEGRTVRWMRVGFTRTAGLSLTLEDWPSAH